jgi:hypothetical protein
MRFAATLFACFTVQCTALDAQETVPSAETVIEKFITAKGGESALRKIKNYTIKGKVYSKQEVVGEFEIYQAANRHHSIERFPDGSTRKHGTDGKLAWQINADGEPALLKGQQARDYIRHYETLHESLEWTKQFDAILYAGTKTVQETKTHHLIFVAPDKRQVNRYFSVETGLLIREEQIECFGKDMQIIVSEIGDYIREKNGTLVSRRRVNRIGSIYSIEYRVESLESNALTDDGVFAVPDSVANLNAENAK